MKGNFLIESPDNVECTLTLTMEFKRWKELRNQLNSGHPAKDLSLLISRLANKMELRLDESVDEQ